MAAPSHPYAKDPEFETLMVHAGWDAKNAQSARAVPIFASGSQVFDNAQHGEDLFGLKTPGWIYSRIANPTVAAFEERITALEGGVGAVATSSGQAAQFMAIFALVRPGDHVVSSSYLYGGTGNQFSVSFKRLGVEVSLVKSTEPRDFQNAIKENTKAIFIETLGNPDTTFTPIKEVAKVAHDNGIPLVVDNTFGMGGYLIRPFEHGADIIVHSATKWIGGHGTTIGGVIIDGGKFDWKKTKSAGFNEPAEGYHGMLMSDLGAGAYGIKVRLEMLRDFGASMNPFAAFLFIQGLETLSLRGARHNENALALAKWLQTHPKVKEVSYLGLESHKSHAIAKGYLRAGQFGAVLNFSVHGGADAARVLLDNLKLAAHLANLGDVKTLVIRPAATTHQQSSAEAQVAAGVQVDMIRVSVGIEHISDIIADFERALSKVSGQ